MRPCLFPVLLLAAACTAPINPAALPQLAADEVRWFRIDRLDTQNHPAETSLLAVQAQPDGTSRWIQTDAFGAPQARMVLSARGWRRDGFIMPNQKSQKLFTAMLPLLKQPAGQPETLQTGRERWQITPIRQQP